MHFNIKIKAQCHSLKKTIQVLVLKLKKSSDDESERYPNDSNTVSLTLTLALRNGIKVKAVTPTVVA